jgi:hypothetical protein
MPMTNRVLSKKPSFRFAYIVSLVVFGMWFLAACDSAEDLVKDIVDVDFEEEATITLDATAEKSASATVTAAGDDCGTTSVNGALAELDIDGLDEIDIESVELNYVDASYSNAAWSPATETLTCRLTITGTQSTEIAETAVSSASGTIDVSLDQDQIDVINYYLANRDQTFTYCLVCDNENSFDSFSVSYSVDINVTVKGEF